MRKIKVKRGYKPAFLIKPKPMVKPLDYPIKIIYDPKIYLEALKTLTFPNDNGSPNETHDFLDWNSLSYTSSTMYMFKSDVFDDQQVSRSSSNYYLLLTIYITAYQIEIAYILGKLEGIECFFNYILFFLQNQSSGIVSTSMSLWDI